MDREWLLIALKKENYSSSIINKKEEQNKTNQSTISPQSSNLTQSNKKGLDKDIKQTNKQIKSNTIITTRPISKGSLQNSPSRSCPESINYCALDLDSLLLVQLTASHEDFRIMQQSYSAVNNPN